MTNKRDISPLKDLLRIESHIEEAMWNAVRDQDHKTELVQYQQAKQQLMQYENLSSDLQRKRDQVLSYCLLRIDEALNNLGDTDKSIERAQEALKYAEHSTNPVQIARSLLNLGTRFLNADDLTTAETHWRRLFTLAEHNTTDDMMQVKGWTLIIRAHVLNGKSLYTQALRLAQEAESTLTSIDNYAGIAAANTILAQIYQNLGDKQKVKACTTKAATFHNKAVKEHK